MATIVPYDSTCTLWEEEPPAENKKPKDLGERIIEVLLFPLKFILGLIQCLVVLFILFGGLFLKGGAEGLFIGEGIFAARDTAKKTLQPTSDYASVNVTRTAHVSTITLPSHLKAFKIQQAPTSDSQTRTIRKWVVYIPGMRSSIESHHKEVIGLYNSTDVEGVICVNPPGIGHSDGITTTPADFCSAAHAAIAYLVEKHKPLPEEHQAFVNQYQTLVKEHEALVEERATLLEEREALLEEHEALIEAFVKEREALVEKLKKEIPPLEIILWGHSLGGASAMVNANLVDYKKYIRGVVLDRTFRRYDRAIKYSPLVFTPCAQLLKAIVKKIFYLDSEAQLPTISCPVVALAATEDEVIDFTRASAIQMKSANIIARYKVTFRGADKKLSRTPNHSLGHTPETIQMVMASFQR